MKHTQLMLAPFGSESDGVVVEKCHNLRPSFSSDGVALRPASLPKQQYPDGWCPLVEVPQADGSTVTLLTNSTNVGVAVKGEIVVSYRVFGRLFSATADVGTVRLAVTGGPVRLRVTADTIAEIETEAPKMPRVMATVKNVALATTVDSYTLSRAYALSAATTATDRRTLSDAALDAYSDLDRQARLRGVWWQPALVQTRLRDAQGNVIMRSAPQLMTHPDGLQYDGVVRLLSDDSRTTLPATVEASAWRAVLLIPQEAATQWADAATLEVVASPTLHVADVRRRCVVNLRRRADDQAFVTIAPQMPAAAAWAGATDDYCRILGDVTERFDELATPILTIANPAKLAGSAVDLPPAPVSDVAADNRAIDRALSHTPPHLTRAEAWLRAPHAVSARLAAPCSEVLMGADLDVRPFAGHAAEEFAIEVENKAWDAFATVTFADGSQAVTASSGSTNAPLTFGPVLSYPAPQAVNITLAVRTAAGLRQGSFDLQPDAAGRRAVYIAPAMRPFQLPATSSFAVPADSRQPIRLPNHIAAMPRSAAATLATAELPGETFTALTPALFGQNAWEIGRGRFLLMTRGGIYSLCLNSARTRLATSLLDDRVVPSPAAITNIDGAVVAATTVGDVITFQGNKVKLFAKDVYATGLAYDAARAELWCMPEGGAATVVCCNFDKLRYTADLAAVGSLTVHLPQGEWLCSPTASYRVGTYQPIAETEIDWQAAVTLSKPAHRMGSLHVAASCKAVDITADVRPATLSAAWPQPLWQRHFQGRIGADIEARFFNTRADRYVLRLSGAVAHDFTFTSYTVNQ